MPADAGSIYSEVRIRLDKLKADIQSVNTAYDQMGAELTSKADKYANATGQKYVKGLQNIATSMKNVQTLVQQGALSEQEAINRTLALRQQELKLIENRAVKEGTASSETIAAITNTKSAISGLQQAQELLAKSTVGDKQSAQLDVYSAKITATTALIQSGTLTEERGIKNLISLHQKKLAILEQEATTSATTSPQIVAAIKTEETAITELKGRQEELRVAQENSSKSFLSSVPKIASEIFYIIRSIRLISNIINDAIVRPLQEAEKAWEAQAEAADKLVAVYNSTGAAAWTTSQHVLDLGKSLASVTKYTDQEIQAMESVLLGFTRIQGINFDRATEAVLNVATVMKYDLTSSAQAVGKALENPTKMMDGLRRQGFYFTDQQKETIKVLESTGHLEEAQNIILSELTKAYGGAARAVADTAAAMKTMKDKALTDLKEEIGKAVGTSGFMVSFRTAIKDIAEAWTGALKSATDYKAWLDKNKNINVTVTTTDVLTQNLAGYEEELRRLKLEAASVGNFTGEVGTYQQAIANLEERIRLTEAAIKGQKNLDAAIQSGNEAAVQKAQDEANAAARQNEISDARIKAVNEYKQAISDTDRQEKVGILTSEKADSERISALQTEIKSLNEIIEKYGLTTGATIDLRNAEEARLAEILKTQVQIESIYKRAEQIDSDYYANRDKAEADAQQNIQKRNDERLALLKKLAGYGDDYVLSEEERTKLLEGYSTDATEWEIANLKKLYAEYQKSPSGNLTALINGYHELKAAIESLPKTDDIAFTALENTTLADKIRQIGDALVSTYQKSSEGADKSIPEQIEYFKKLRDSVDKTSEEWQFYQAAIDSLSIDNLKALEKQYGKLKTTQADSLDSLIAWLEEYIKTEKEAGKDTTDLENKLNSLKLTKAEAAVQKWGDTFLSTISQILSAMESLYSAQAAAQEKAVEEQLKALEKSYGSTADHLESMYEYLEDMGADEAAASIKAQYEKEKAIEDYADLTSAELKYLYEQAIANNDATTASYIAKAKARVDAEQEAADEENLIEYNASLASWKMQKASAIASAAQAILNGYLTKPFIPAGLAAGTLAAVLGGVQVAAVEAAKPVYYAASTVNAATGGIVLPDSTGTGTLVNVAENKHKELLLNDSAEGSSEMNSFADKIAERINSGAQEITVPLVVSGKTLAEVVVTHMNNGNVRVKTKK